MLVLVHVLVHVLVLVLVLALVLVVVLVLVLVVLVLVVAGSGVMGYLVLERSLSSALLLVAGVTTGDRPTGGY